jgi:hypothetical protein
MIALLTRESEDLISAALRPNQVGILLTLLAAAAKAVAVELRADRSERSHAFERWNALNAALNAKISALLSRFRDNEGHLEVLSELLQHMSPSGGQKAFKAVLGALTEISFTATTSTKISTNVLTACSRWLRICDCANATRQSCSSASTAPGTRPWRPRTRSLQRRPSEEAAVEPRR